MSIYEVTLIDPTETARPAERVLKITAVDQMVFLDIADYDEGNPKTTITSKESIAVSLPALRDALALMSEDVHREDQRDRDQSGLKANIAGTRVGMVRL